MHQTLLTTLTIPEGAEPTPPGWCASCGQHPAATLYSAIHLSHVAGDTSGCCDSHTLARPVDPAQLVRHAAMRVLQTDLGYAADGADGMAPAMADRMRRLVDRSITTWTAR